MKKLLIFLLLLLLTVEPLSAATLATDNFNRANAPDPGANWSGGAFTTFEIITNQAVPITLGSDCLAVYDGGITWPADQYSQAKITVTGTAGGNVGPGVVVRATSDMTNYYRVVLDHSASNNVEISKMVSSSHTVLANRTTTWVDGDVLRLEITGTGASRVLKVFKNGVQLGANIADASGGIDSANRPGITYSSSVTSASADDWEGGSMTAASSVVPILLSHRRRRNQ